MWGTMLTNVKSADQRVVEIVAKSIARLAPTSARHFDDKAKRDGIMGGVLELCRNADEEI